MKWQIDRIVGNTWYISPASEPVVSSSTWCMLGVLFTAVFLSVGGNAFLAGEQDIVLLTAVVQGTSFEFGPIHVNMTAIATSRGVCFGPTPTTNIITQGDVDGCAPSGAIATWLELSRRPYDGVPGLDAASTSRARTAANAGRHLNAVGAISTGVAGVGLVLLGCSSSGRARFLLWTVVVVGFALSALSAGGCILLATHEHIKTVLSAYAAYVAGEEQLSRPYSISSPTLGTFLAAGLGFGILLNSCFSLCAMRSCCRAREAVKTHRQYELSERLMA